MAVLFQGIVILKHETSAPVALWDVEEKLAWLSFCIPITALVFLKNSKDWLTPPTRFWANGSLSLQKYMEETSARATASDVEEEHVWYDHESFS